jgi:Ca2+/Na+ antiporter
MIYFDPNVWGTVSDWSMVFVMVVTAYYLYKTLKSQREVQQTQNKLFEIENLKFREGNKPSFEFKISHRVPNNETENQRLYSVEITNKSDNIALEFSVKYDQNSTSVSQVFMGDQFPRKHLQKDDNPWLIHFVSDDRVSIHFITLTLNYEDVSGLKYKQGVLLILDRDNSEINPFLPEILK